MIIGIVGFLGSGKGTAGDILIEQHGYTRVSFADALKDAVSVIFGWPRDLLEGDTETSRIFRETRDRWWSERFGYEVTPRHMLQLMGTEAGRDVFNENVWVHTVASRIKSMMENESKDKFVIPDVRFPNELDFIRRNGGHIIRVARGPNPEWYDLAHAANNPTFTHSNEAHAEMVKTGVHYSEWAWIGQQFDYQLDNNGDLIMLESDIKHMTMVFTGPKKPDTMSNVA
jgi:hypothetical protein